MTRRLLELAQSVGVIQDCLENCYSESAKEEDCFFPFNKKKKKKKRENPTAVGPSP